MQGRSHGDFLVRLKDAMPGRDRDEVLQGVAGALRTMGFHVQVRCALHSGWLGEYGIVYTHTHTWGRRRLWRKLSKPSILLQTNQ